MSTILRVSTLLIGCLAGQALALDPTEPIGSYLQTHFSKEDGLPSPVVNVILQTRNGFLWVGTGGGLSRFDGRHFTTVEFPLEVQPEGLSHALAEGPDGDLWAATVTGALRIPSTALDQFGRLPATVYHAGTGPGDTIIALQFSGDGVLWAGTERGLYRLERGAFSIVLPDVSVSRIEKASNGRLLIITSAGFFEWDGARLVDHRDIAARLGVSANQIFHVMEDHTGARWYCTDAGVARDVNGSIERLQPYGLHVGLSAYRAYEDAEGNVWLNLAGGLYRASAAGYEPLPGARARYIYADSDGDLWLGTNGDGLVRLKNRIARTFTKEDGLHSNAALTVADAGGGRLWIGTSCGGLALFDGHAFRTYSHEDGLTNACVFAVATDRNNDVWVGTYGGGLFRFRDGRFTQFSKPEGLPAAEVLSIVTARDGTLWLVTPHGISHMQDEHFRNYTTADGLSNNVILGVYQDRRGVIWAGTPAGIDRLSGDRFMAIAQVPGAHDYRILGEDSLGGLYANAAPEGIFRIEGDRLITVTNRLNVSGMMTYQGNLWFCGDGISRAATDALQRWEHDRDSPMDYAHFGRGDGLMSTDCSSSPPTLAVTSDGKLWAAMLQGLTMLDLSRMPRNHRKPTIYMEQTMVGRTMQPPGRELILPPGPHHVELHFGVIELASPEKIHMQYRLDDVDQDWLDADANTGAIYPSFPAGTHKLHIRACNSDGVWDRAGIVYYITQTPYYYETKLFRFMLLGMFGLLLAAAYHLRMRRLTAEMNARMDERVAERTRLARDLHDTLIQTIHGSKMVADAGLDDRHDAGRLYQALERVSSCLSQAAEEGRAALTALRSSATQRNDLAEALARAGQDCILRNPMTFALTVKGTAREMHPIVRDEVYRIAYEAMRNACSHSRGTELNVELTYARDLTVAVRDNGIGFDEERIAKGKDGHFGVRGMRERAERIGAKLHFDSTRSGTHVELIVPAKLTFREGPVEKRSLFKELLHFFRQDR